MSSKSKNTPKGLTFQICDENLVRDIIKYQEAKGLPTFISSVRQLCNLGLQHINNKYTI